MRRFKYSSVKESGRKSDFLCRENQIIRERTKAAEKIDHDTVFSAVRALQSVKERTPQRSCSFDKTLHRKIARGRLQIEARIDLHGLIQQEAYLILLHFFQSLQHRGLRNALVITGKGSSSGSTGVLRQVVPYWLVTAPFRLYVNAFEPAARRHGGTGALYVRVRHVFTRKNNMAPTSEICPATISSKFRET